MEPVPGPRTDPEVSGADPDPYQYVTDPQHCFLQDCIFKYRSSSVVPTSTEFRPLFYV
jgi:hypothetical protein